MSQRVCCGQEDTGRSDGPAPVLGAGGIKDRSVSGGQGGRWPEVASSQRQSSVLVFLWE